MQTELVAPIASVRIRLGWALGLVVLGGSTAMLQTLAVREGLAIASGNEAVLSLVFGAWLALTGLGAFASRWIRVSSGRGLPLGLVAYGLVQHATLVAIRAASGLLPLGEVPSLLLSGAGALVLLAPSCLLSGWLYGLFAKGPPSSSDDHGVWAARAYGLETLGAAACGAVLAFWALEVLAPFTLAGLALSGAVLGAALLLSRLGWASAILALCFGLLSPALGSSLERRTASWLLTDQSLVQSYSSPRGALWVTQSHGQTQLLWQRELLLSTADAQGAEQSALLPLSLHSSPKRVLVVGVCPSGTYEKMRAQGAEHIDVLLGDEVLAKALLHWDKSSQTPGVSLLGDDERGWVRAHSGADYDLVLVQAPSPSSVSGARLFSQEFYRDLKRVLGPNGQLAVAMPAHSSYANEPEQQLHSTVARTLSSVFTQLRVLPAGQTWYLASDAALPSSAQLLPVVEQRLGERAQGREYVTSAWLKDALSPERLKEAEAWAGLSVQVSTDTQPLVYRRALDALLSQWDQGGLRGLIVLAGTLALGALLWFRPTRRPVAFSVASTGFSGLGLQLVLMAAYQTAVGALYRDVALVGASFMGASYLASVWASRGRYRFAALWALDVLQVAVAAGLAALIPVLTSLSAGQARGLLVLGAALIGALTGGQVAYASRAPCFAKESSGAAVYALDLLGGALAAWLTYTLLVPSFGLWTSCALIAGLKVLSSIALRFGAKEPAEALAELRVPGPAVAFVLLLAMAASDAWGRNLYGLSLSLGYALSVVLVLAGTLALGFETPAVHDKLLAIERRTLALGHRLGLSPLRIVAFLVLLPLAVLPLGRCMFRVPYLFCHVCPRPCAFGVLRPYLVPSVLLANWGDHRFCTRICPVGQAQRVLGTEPKRRLGAWSRWVSWTLLALVAGLYLWAPGAMERGLTQGLWGWLALHRYGTSAVVLGTVALLLLFSFFVERPYCQLGCPLGAASRALLPVQRLVQGAKR